MDPGDAADALTKELEDCAERWLRPYLDRLQSGELHPRPKVINDALWGSIRLESWEVAILDTRLVQRLRFLRQLGVAHWVYPSAGHSRLEHSLGVLHQMEALLAAVERSAAAGNNALDDSTRKLLRIAALIHDCGHAVMSHVSEEFINDLPGVAALRSRLHREFNPRKRPSASECFAAVFVQSPAFRQLLRLPVTGAAFIRDVEKATRQIAALILGGPAIAEAAFLTLLVNGAFDADKLDYMPRDSLMAGVPCPIDAGRVIETVRVVDVPREMLHPKYPKWAGLPATVETIRVLTLAGSGARVLDELAMARTLLFDKVYFHHKVRALEVMVRRALRSLPRRSISEWLDLVDDELLVGTSRSTFDSVRSRDLLKRAVVLTPPSSKNGSDSATPEEQAWARLMGELESLRFSLNEESVRVAGILGAGRQALARQAPEVDAPPVQKIGLDQHAFVGDNVEEFEKASATRSGQRPEAGRLAGRQSVYIFAPEGAVLPVFVAARTLLRRNYGIDIEPEAYRATRLDPEMIASAEATLAGAGYFGSVTPSVMGPARIASHRQTELETFLRTSWSRIERLAVEFGQYQPLDASPISPDRIGAFLRQFGTERLARTALLVLESVDFKDRQFFTRALKGCLAALPNETVVSPLGSAGDSSAFLSYVMNDLDEADRRMVIALELALDPDGPAPSGGPIVLWDDFCGRAGHAATAISQWLELPRIAEDAELLLDEDLVFRLNETRKARLLAREVHVAFAMGRPTGISELRSFLQRHGLSQFHVLEPYATVQERNRPLGSTEVIASNEDRHALVEFLNERMTEALEPHLTRANRPWTPAKLGQRLLGYGGEAHLIVFPYNVPTVTLTALWAEGPNWIPLFRRRGKQGT